MEGLWRRRLEKKALQAWRPPPTLTVADTPSMPATAASGCTRALSSRMNFSRLWLALKKVMRPRRRYRRGSRTSQDHSLAGGGGRGGGGRGGREREVDIQRSFHIPALPACEWELQTGGGGDRGWSLGALPPPPGRAEIIIGGPDPPL